MKPNEFWNCTYQELKLFCDSNFLQKERDLKEKIILLEQFGNKLINAFNFKKPKNRSLVKDVFKELFEEDLRPDIQSTEEQIRNMRNWS